PSLAQDAVGPPRVHAGAPRDGRRAHARAGATVPRAGDAEPDRVRGHLSAARGAGRPLHGAGVARLSDAGGRGRDARQPRRRRRDPRDVMRGAVGAGALGVALMVLGVVVDAEPLLVPGAALLAMAAAAAGWVAAAARGAAVERKISARRVMEEEPLSVHITARSGTLPFPGGALVDGLLPQPAALRCGRSVARVRIDARFARRGPRVLAAPNLALRDPLGIAEGTVGGGEDERVLVLPRLHPVVAAGEGSPLQSGGHAAPVAGAEVELDGLRPYRDGAPASRIHWAALARGAGLLERRLRPEGEGRPLVVLDASGPAEADDLDAAVRAAASLGHALARAGGCSILLPGDRRATPLEADGRGWPATHARLALVAP